MAGPAAWQLPHFPRSADGLQENPNKLKNKIIQFNGSKSGE